MYLNFPLLSDLMIWGKFPGLDFKALQARSIRERMAGDLYLMISVYQQEASQDVGSDLIPCSPVFTWGTHVRPAINILLLSHRSAGNDRQPPHAWWRSAEKSSKKRIFTFHRILQRGSEHLYTTPLIKSSTHFRGFLSLLALFLYLAGIAKTLLEQKTI